ncbi:dual specificity mitogen-activated protein kinase kinase 5 isoform X3 [Carassius carassius]|uniref:dual specificity mitogen-activated protein kinase kinase 5 isoform X3 n=1 Tax=Carassius carassius TaxID=217509 RepID=UPI0028683DE5|nr:dual specificity mitogen-activated protein kinase kinase 5 isoform X3 [Carassius carassius]
MLLLVLNNQCSMESEEIVIRIKTPLGDMDSSVDCPSHLNFSDLLGAIKDVMPEATVTAFEYEDEVGDRITVRSDEELKAMLSYYCNTVMEQRINGLLPEPLQIFPRAGKTPGIRNIHGLKVNTRPESSCGRGSSAADSRSSDSSLKKSSAELKKILTNGQSLPLAWEENCSSEGKNNTYFYSAFFVENRISICTEFMDGGSLDVYWRIPEHVLGRIAVAVVKGLTYLWSLKILHRDVKPSNMLVNTRGQVKLCDFGVSTQLVNSIAKTYVGTNAYMAPERISGEQYGIHSDVWSVGISFMELALGSFPYPQIQKNQGSLMPLQLLQCIVDEDPPVLPIGQFSEKFVHFITQCMRKQPKERPAPNNLMDHPFIMQYNDGNTEVVSMWVCRSLEDRKSQQAQRHM